MSGIILKMVKAAMLTTAFVFLTGCNFSSQFVVNAVAKEPPIRSAWIAYWDLEPGERDLVAIGDRLNQLSYFGAYFDKNDHLFIPPELRVKQEELKKMKGNYQTYLTFINDKQNADGTVKLKDIEVLRRLFSDDISLEKHVDEIISLTLQGGYDGIELDYERIWKDDQIGRLYINFARRLYEKAERNHLKLRIVLEPSTSFASASFFNGPEYVVMFYNLYGLHSTPGPKADKDFIEKVAERMKFLPGKKSIALSTGGCLWGSNGKKSFLTEMEAKTLAEQHGSELVRDEDSQCIIFDYKDKEVSYQVWYADVTTLNYWISIANQQGINNISLWRLGGNIEISKIQ